MRLSSLPASPLATRRRLFAVTGATLVGGILPTLAASPARAQGDARPSAAAATAAPRITTLEGGPPHQILFIGNSYFYYNNSLHNHVRRLAVAADPKLGSALAYKSATIGGSPLHHHAIDHYLQPQALGNKEAFDLVILQTLSDAAMSAAGRERYDATVDAFAPKIRAAGGRVALYITPSYVKPHKSVDPEMLARTTEMIVTAANRLGALAIPVGQAYEASYRQRPDLSLHQDYDGSHPSLAGSYLAACVVYASLYGQSPVGNSYDYYGRVDRETAGYLQKVAAETVAGFYGSR